MKMSGNQPRSRWCCRMRVKTCVILIVMATVSLFAVNLISQQVADMPGAENKAQRTLSRGEIIEAWRMQKSNKVEPIMPAVPCRGSKCARFMSVFGMDGAGGEGAVVHCKHPKLDLKSDILSTAFNNKHKKLECTSERSPASLNYGIIAPIPTYFCIAESVVRVSDDEIEYTNPIMIASRTDIRNQVQGDFLRVECLKDEKVHADLHMTAEVILNNTQQVMKSQGADRTEYLTHISPYPDMDSPDLCEMDQCLPYNVLVIGVGGMSHMNFQRLLPETYSLMVEEFNSLIFSGYNVVDEGSIGAFIPLLTGYSVDSQKEVKRENSDKKTQAHYVDKLNLLWKAYDQAGYMTLFAEDHPQTNTFNEFLHGFETSPTSHYMRPFWLSVDEDKKQHSQYCLNKKPKHRITLDYLRQFYDAYPTDRKFAMIMFQELSRSDVNHARYLDADIEEFFSEFEGLKDTIVILTSDYGRHPDTVITSEQSRLEARMPLLSIYLPHDLLLNHADLAKNVTNNEDKLVTPYDVHAMLQDIIDVPHMMRTEKSTHYKKKSSGISLFRNIPSNRTCESADVPIHWCGCLASFEVQRSQINIDQITQVILTGLNEKIREHQGLCHKYTSIQIVNITRVVPHEKIKLYEAENAETFTGETALDIDYYRILFSPSPEPTLKITEVFDVTIQHHNSGLIFSSKYSLASDIYRITSVKDSNCIKLESYALQYCLCRS